MNHKHTHFLAGHRDKKAGQAMIEMVVAMVAILLLIVGLLQLGLLSHAHTQSMLEARERADASALNPDYQHMFSNPPYLQDWNPGPDGARYSVDDQPVSGPAQDIPAYVSTHALPTPLAAWAGPNPVGDVHASAHVTDAMLFVEGESQSDPVPMYPLIRNLVVQNESIRMSHRVWMPWTRGLDE
jgi:hypothetical protein